ncbi:MAG: hypothetical protein KDD15_12155 [Lewinella sp.]|nr:hypothetical protein [Lewinella sp.]
MKNLDYSKVMKFARYAKKRAHRPLSLFWIDSLRSVFKYNIAIEEFYQFRFFELPEQAKSSFAGTGYMYEYQRIMNPPVGRLLLADKIQFLRAYRTFVKHEYATIDELRKDPDLARRLLQTSSGKIVLKSTDGQCGRGIEVHQSKGFTPDSLLERLISSGNDFVEAFVTQHRELMRLSPSGLNTVRVITQLDKDNQVDIIGTRLRITVNSPVDNLAAGNIAAPIDVETGRVTGPGVYSDITKTDEYQHPVTGVDIVGFQVPFWPQTIQMCKEAALVDTRNRSIGWDVAITDEGPELIEGNHDWCKLLWQLPVKQGLKPVLEKYRKELVEKI